MVMPIKCVACGDAAVGKTCMLISFVENKFPEKYVPTVFDNHNITMDVDGSMTELSIWDTAGTEDYALIRPLSYSNTDVFLLCFSLIDSESMHNVKSFWYEEIEKEQPGTEMFMVGLKSDLRKSDNSRIIPLSECKNFAEGMGIKYFECSALTQEGLKEIFEDVIRKAVVSRAKKERAQDAQELRQICCTIF